MISQLETTIIQAGEIILNYYRSSFEVNLKEDKSPLTPADKESHLFLVNALPKIIPIPVLSEEEDVPYDERKDWDNFWLIDPLDGTLDFINKSDEFTINIALIKKNEPVFGLIYAPALKELYYAKKGSGFFYKGPQRPQRMDMTITAALSRFYNSSLTTEFLNINKITKTTTVGSALKFGRLALGEFDIYPRYEGSKEWDTAAGQIILKEAKYTMFDLETKIEPLYNKMNLKNNYFLACHSKIKPDTLKYLDFV